MRDSRSEDCCEVEKDVNRGDEKRYFRTEPDRDLRVTLQNKNNKKIHDDFCHSRGISDPETGFNDQRR